MGLSIYVPLSVSTKSDFRDPEDLLKDVKKFIEVKNIYKKIIIIIISRIIYNIKLIF